jgi:hypothetical protein
MAVGGHSHVPATLPPGKKTGYPFYRGWVSPRDGLNVRTYMRSLTVTGKFSEIYSGKSGFGTGFSASASVSPVDIIPPVLRTHLHLHVAPTGRTNMQS